MKTIITLLAAGSMLLVPAPVLRAQVNSSTNNSGNASANASSNSSTNISTPTSTVTNAQARRSPRALAGVPLLLPAGIKEKLKLNEGQKTEFNQIAEDFAKTSQEYKTANQPRLDAAEDANWQAHAAKDEAQIQAARAQLQQVWAGLQPYRVAAVARIKPMLMPDQLKILEDPKNQWPENQASEPSSPSAN